MFTQFKRLLRNAGLWAMLSSLLSFTVALAASGDLDPTFGDEGRVTNFVVPANPAREHRSYGLAIHSNRKIVAAGYSRVPATGNYDFAVTRYNTDGSLDPTFSGDGKLITNFGGDDRAYDVAVQPDGKIVATGYTCISDFSSCNVAVARYKAGGALDTTFSGDGKVITNYGTGNNGSIGGLAIQSNGKILVAGYTYNGADINFAIYRYNPNGSLDTTFSGDGVAVGNFGVNQHDFAHDLALQSDGKIVIVGVTGNANGHNFAVARLNPNGSADFTFSGDGRQTTNFGADDYAYGLAVQSNGKIVVVGEKRDSIARMAIVRYNPNGSPDTTFNGTGKKALSIFPGISSHAYNVLVQSNGKIVVVGGTQYRLAPHDYEFALVRLNPGGTFDTTFSGDGKVAIDFFAGDDLAYALARQPWDGKYVLGGYAFRSDVDFALVRLLP